MLLQARVEAGILHRITIIFTDHALSLITAWPLSGWTFFIDFLGGLDWGSPTTPRPPWLRQRVKWRHRVYGHDTDTIIILWV